MMKFIAAALFTCCFLPRAISQQLDPVLKSADSIATIDSRRAIQLSDSLLAQKPADPAPGALLRIKGKAYYFKGDYDSAAVFFNQSLVALPVDKFPKQNGLTLLEQAKLLRKTHMLKGAQEAYEKAREIFTQLNDSSNLASTLNESGVVYEYLGDYDIAINNYKQSLQIQQALGDKVGMAYAYNFISGASMLKNDMPQALEAGKLSQQMFAASGDEFATAYANASLGEIYFKNQQLDSAKYWMGESVIIAQKLNLPELQSSLYKKLSEVYSAEQRFDSAYYFEKSANAIRDTLFNRSTQETIAELNEKYLSAEKDNFILQQKDEIGRKNTFLIIVLSVLAILAALAYVFFRETKIKQQKKLQDAVMAEQNAATIAVLNAEENERRRISGSLHDGLGQLLSVIKMNLQTLLDSENHNEKSGQNIQKTLGLVDKSITEVRAVSHQMMPENIIRSGLGKALKQLVEEVNSDKLNINLDIFGMQQPVDQHVQLSLYRIFQECINNVIKHAKADKLFITMDQDDQYIHATVEDNGIGFDLAKLKGESGMGIENIKSRVKFLKGKMDLSSSPGNGTSIAIHIPV